MTKRSGVDVPNTGYIGQSVPRPNAKRLLEGRGTYVDDLRLPRLAHVCACRGSHTSRFCGARTRMHASRSSISPARVRCRV
jgi:hypothetical protein